MSERNLLFTGGVIGGTGNGERGGLVSFEEDAGAYNQKDAEGFIKLNALRMRVV